MALPYFYSALERAVTGAPARLDGLPADQWLAWLQANSARLGCKREELEWTGIEGWLSRQAGGLSRQSVTDYLVGHRVSLDEVIRRDGLSLERREAMAQQMYGEPFRSLPSEDKYRVDDALRREAGTTKYENYVLPGGDEYRELLLTLPVRVDASQWTTRQYREDGWTVMDETGEVVGNFPAASEAEALQMAVAHRAKAPEQRKGRDFVSDHWDERNILVHVRFQTRQDAAQGKVLLVDEIQSDWGQSARKQGVAGTPVDARFPGREGAEFANNLVRGGGVVPVDGQWSFRRTGGVPAAPFIGATKTWLALAIKRIIGYAVSEGFDSVAFVSGAQAAATLNISKQVGHILHGRSSEDGELFVAVYDHDDIPIFKDNDISQHRLESVLGKDVARRIMAGEGEPMAMPFPGHYRRLSGDGLTAGGKGLCHFYDQVVPQVAGEVVRKLGGTLGTVVLGSKTADEIGAFLQEVGREAGTAPGGLVQPGFVLTPAMKSRVIADGLPLFQSSVSGHGPVRAQFQPGSYTMTLFESADRTSFIHETGHFFLESSLDFAARPGAPAQIIEDAGHVLRWLGVEEGLAGWQALADREPFHEQFARAFEAYLMVAEPPVPELAGMFQSAKVWLQGVYSDVSALGVNVSPEIKAVFDRLVQPARSAQAQTVAQELEERLVKLYRFPPDVCAIYASMVANFYEAQAVRSGVPVRVLADRFPLTVEAVSRPTPRRKAAEANPGI